MNDTEVGAFEDQDANADETLEENEFTSWYEERGFTNDWDAGNEGLYTNDEVKTGLFGSWDRNNDEAIDTDGYNKFGYDNGL